MLSNTGYFKTMPCPFFDLGFCERPFCHFKHRKKEDLPSSGPSRSLEVPSESAPKQEYFEPAVTPTAKESVLIRKILIISCH